MQWVNNITLGTLYSFPISFTKNHYFIVASEKNEGHQHALWVTDCTGTQYRLRSSSTMGNTCSIFAVGY